MKYKLVIFDWDGTLMDSAGRIVSSMQTASAKAGLPVPSDEAVRDIIGLSIEPAFLKLFGEQHKEKGPALLEHYREAYVHTDETPSPLFKGAKELLADLHQQQRYLAVATGKARRGLERVWQQSDTKGFFHTSRCADEAQSKPHPDMLEQILAELNFAPEDAVMVGDTSYDMAMAEALGMDRIAMSHGAHPLHKLEVHQPLAIANNIEELARHL